MTDKKTLLVIGAKWLDKTNGNTYCNAKVIDGATGDTEFYIGYQYGYGNQYFYEAKKAVEERYGESVKVIDIGCFKVGRKDLKNNAF